MAYMKVDPWEFEVFLFLTSLRGVSYHTSSDKIVYLFILTEKVILYSTSVKMVKYDDVYTIL